MGFQFTQPEALQVKFISVNTGTHASLKAYLEAAEKGGKTLGQLISELFDEAGTIRDQATPAALAAAVTAATTQAQNAEASAEDAAVAAANAAAAVTSTLAGQVAAATNQANLAAASQAATLGIYNDTLATVSNFMGRNRILNGAMTVAQRGVSFPNIGLNTYHLDRWVNHQQNAGTYNVAQSSDAPLPEFKESLSYVTASAFATTGFSSVVQRIEGYNVRDLTGKTFTLSFWVKSSIPGTYCVSFSNATDTRSFIREYQITAANTWQKIVLTVPSGLPNDGVWQWTTGVGLKVNFMLGASATYQGAANTWIEGNTGNKATANQVDVGGTLEASWLMVGAQLEVGGIATPFEHRPYGAELALCQRYYESSQNVNIFSGNTNASSAYYHTAYYRVQKRNVPTMTFFLEGNGGGFDLGNPLLLSSGVNAVAVYKTATATANGAFYQYRWTASAELNS